MAASVVAQAGNRNAGTLGLTSGELDRALERRDTIELKQMLHPDARYGHSNGWVQRRADVLADLYNGRLRYNAITRCGDPQVRISGRIGTVREELSVDIIMNEGRGDTALRMKLAVLQVWRYEQGRWQLLERQSGRIPDTVH